MSAFGGVPHPGLSQQDQLTYWLLRLSESLHRLNEGLLWAGASPGEFGRLMTAPQFGERTYGCRCRSASPCEIGLLPNCSRRSGSPETSTHLYQGESKT